MSARRRRTYRRAMSAARLAGVSDTDIAEVVTALGANPSPDDLYLALAQYEPDLYAPEPRSPFGDGALRVSASERAEQAARVDGPAGGGDSATGSCVSPGRAVELPTSSLGDHALLPAPRSHNASGGPRSPGSPAACPRTPSDASSPRGASDGPTSSTTVAA